VWWENKERKKEREGRKEKKIEKEVTLVCGLSEKFM
jgi:hypothetical protein